ncbi:MAG: adenylate/guanylate cyclase domain-containing protein [Patescibacteria group bacterium]
MTTSISKGESGEPVAVKRHDGSVLSALDNDSAGFAIVIPDSDDVVRRTIFSANGERGGVVKSFDALLAERATGNDPIETEADGADSAATGVVSGDIADITNAILPKAPIGPSLIAFRAVPGAYHRVSFVDILREKDITEADFKDAIVLVGATAPILQDLRVTPISSTPMSGVEIHANAIQQLLEGKILSEQSGLSQIFVTFVLALVAAVTTVFLPLSIGIMSVVALGVLYFFAAFFFFGKGVVLNLVYPYVALIFTLGGGLVYRYMTELRKKLYLRKAFAHYVNESVVEQIVQHPELLRLGGERRTVSVLFTDIVSFTSLAEGMEPEAVVTLLNEYLDVMSAVVFQNKGTLDKYEGDAIMAFFGAPLSFSDHAELACRSALAMRHALSALHEKWSREGKPLIDFKVGISTGDVIVGNLGSKDRFDYTVIGDTVNLGARLESANRRYGTKILIDAATKEKVEGMFVFRTLDMLRVKGKQKPVQVYELMGEQGAIGEQGLEILKDFEDGRALYAKGNFPIAMQYFNSALEKYSSDGPSQIFRDRCSQFIKHPPEPGWDGVVELEGK